MKAEQKRVHSKAYKAARFEAAKMGSDEKAKDLLTQPVSSPFPLTRHIHNRHRQTLPTTDSITTTTATTTTTTTNIPTTTHATHHHHHKHNNHHNHHHHHNKHHHLCECLATLPLVKIGLLCMFSGFVAREDGIAVYALLTLAVIRSNISGRPLQHSMLSSAPT
jgi:hypothetical protein